MSDVSFGLMGSGEFEPWAAAVDRWLLDRATGDGSVLILPAASAPEGDEVFDRWGRMGIDHYRTMGVEARVVPLKTSGDAERHDLIGMLDEPSMAFFSGGNPAYLASVLRGSSFWLALLEQMGRGMAYGGCSAGVACLGERAVDSTVMDFTSTELWKPGLRLFPDVFFGPHWDMLDTYVPGLQEMFVSAIPPGASLLAIDERTAVVGDGLEWTVVGSGNAHLIQAGGRQSFDTGISFRAAMLPAASVKALPVAADPDSRPAG